MLELNDQTINAVNKFVETIHSAFEERNADLIIKLSEISFSEFGQAYPARGSNLANEFKKNLESNKDASSVKFVG